MRLKTDETFQIQPEKDKLISASELLVGALRQYRHNNSDEFVEGYEITETQAIVSELIKLQPDPEPFDFEMAEAISISLDDLEVMENDPFYGHTAHLLRDAAKRLKR